MGIRITSKGAEIINTYLQDPSQQNTSMTLAQADWTIENGEKKNDGRIVFRSASAHHGYWAKDLHYEKKSGKSYFDENAYFQCEVDGEGNKVEPSCEMDGNMTTEAPTSSLKGRILMAALSPSEVGGEFKKKYAKEISQMREKLRGAGMTIP